MNNIIQFNDNDKFLPINVYKFPLGNCGGISDIVKTIYIPCVEGFINYSDIENKDLIFIEEQRSPDYWALKPNTKRTGVIGPMSGGNLAYSSDSRCKRIYHIHDRYESQEVYNTLSK